MLAISGGASRVSAPLSRQPRGDTTVVIQTFAFQPKLLEIPVGTRVTWSNADEIEHTVTALADSGATPLFDGDLSGKDKTFGFTVTRAGTVIYQCARHTFMRGEIRVTPRGDH